MSKTIEQKRRELFEAWMAGQVKMDKWALCQQDKDEFFFMNAHGQYSKGTLQSAWAGFNAALDAVEIEFPGSELDESRAIAIDECRDAIESTGLGLRVKQ